MRRRSQVDRTTWAWMTRLIARWLPPREDLPPLAASAARRHHLRQEPVVPLVRIGAPGNGRPYRDRSAGRPLADGRAGVLSDLGFSCLLDAMRVAGAWSLLPSAMLSLGCYSPNVPFASGEESEGMAPSTSSASGDLGGSGSNPVPESDTGGVVETEATTVPPTSSLGTSMSDDGVDSSTGVRRITADDCGPTEICIDSVCGDCSGAADPDAACAATSPEQPFCGEAGECVACTADVCGGDTPACDPDVGCVVCTEHAQCPDSACHLAGPDAGSCFGVADVVEVTDAVEFQAEFAMLEPGDQRVFRVSGAMPGMGSYSFIGVEVAIVGDAGAEMMGGFTNLFFVDADSLLYVASVRISDGSFRAFNNAGSLWLDDVDVSAFTIAALSTGELRLRRSRLTAVADGGADGVAIQVAGSLSAENSALGPGATVGLQLDTGATVDLRYLTIAGNETAVDCGGEYAGTVRNSIITSTTAGSLTACNNVDWVDDAVDELGYGEIIGGYDADWFVDPASGDFHLSAAGAVAIGNIADWDEGDPLVDIDGELRPMESEGRPGLDEP